jgi:gamma-glutamyl:cysteine ligase YbdK (ATP-grasp superfamily)
MGQEIDSNHFTKRDRLKFEACLQHETALLKTWFREQRFDALSGIAGYELEACLIDSSGKPAPINQILLEKLDNPLVVPELAAFNVEFNVPERRLHRDALSRMDKALRDLWNEADRCAQSLSAALVMIGTLPAVQVQDLTLANLSDRRRYRALNDQVLRMRGGRPLQLNIHGPETLAAEHHNVMLEAAATSFQLHLQVSASEAAAFFNAAVMLSAPMVAATANSPFLFGKRLWEETRIPLFEQAVALGGDLAGGNRSDRGYRRVTFGSGYLRDSLFDLFEENLRRYPPLLPECIDAAPERLHHLRLHNGTIWRWNRPLIGFSKDGTPHLRIEHRVVPAGPSITDAIANAALFYGLVHALGRVPELCQRLPFWQSCRNFYEAARYSLRAEVVWLEGKSLSVQKLLLDELLPLASKGLETLEIDRGDIEHYLGIIQARIASGCTGARWQRSYVARYGRDMNALTRAYLDRQRSGAPVHEWGL